MKKLLFFVIFLSVYGINTTLADTGCLYLGYLYTHPSGLYYGNPPGTTFGFGNYPAYDYPTTADRLLNSNAFCRNATANPCRITSPINQWGTLTTFTITQCPLDDYVWFLILAISACTFFYLKKKIPNSGKFRTGYEKRQRYLWLNFI